jgi:transcription factor IIIB subunit 2
MSVSDFRSQMYDEQADPPSFSQNREKEKLKLLSKSAKPTEDSSASKDSLDQEMTELENEVTSFLPESERAANSIAHAQKEARKPSAVLVSDSPNLSDVDDDEIKACILDDDEVTLKTKIWNEVNREYLLHLKGFTNVDFYCFTTDPVHREEKIGID